MYSVRVWWSFCEGVCEGVYSVRVWWSFGFGRGGRSIVTSGKKKCPPPGSHVFQGTETVFEIKPRYPNVISRVVKRLYYSHINKTALPLTAMFQGSRAYDGQTDGGDNHNKPVNSQLTLPTKHKLYVSGCGTINTNCIRNNKTLSV
ncbi:hypothetical protein DPMN_055060 [Dreissena polymorpha]|uniref:Uncharacterized protein n=1 Tax=Dreissena polymorpha TaxID=45954 RepID=A0A9D4CR33_DREPO|nr:hypothetical protein DPMN_055060 [Dreissena polymorpha]